MAKDILHDAVFSKVVALLDPIVKDQAGFSALQAMEAGRYETTDQVQVVTYLMQIGLSAILRSRGMEYDAMIGHSMGEIAASVVAGCLTPEEGTLIISLRSKLYRSVMGAGAMLLVNIPYAHMKEELDGQSIIVVAIDASPSSYCGVWTET